MKKNWGQRATKPAKSRLFYKRQQKKPENLEIYRVKTICGTVS